MARTTRTGLSDIRSMNTHAEIWAAHYASTQGTRYELPQEVTTPRSALRTLLFTLLAATCAPTSSNPTVSQQENEPTYGSVYLGDNPECLGDIDGGSTSPEVPANVASDIICDFSQND